MLRSLVSQGYCVNVRPIDPLNPRCGYSATVEGENCKVQNEGQDQDPIEALKQVLSQFTYRG